MYSSCENKPHRPVSEDKPPGLLYRSTEEACSEFAYSGCIELRIDGGSLLALGLHQKCIAHPNLSTSWGLVMPHIHTILHPTDLSETSNAAFRLACALAHDYGSELLVLHVYPPPFNGADAVDRDRSDDLEHDLLDALHKLSPQDTTLKIDYRVEEGSPAEVILDVARNCDLIVMGTHGRGAIARAIMGSVAEHVLREASCPVITVRPSVTLPAEVTAGGVTEDHDNLNPVGVESGG